MTAPVPELVEETADEVSRPVRRPIAAHDTIAGLRQQTQCDGPLAEVLARLTHPTTLDTSSGIWRRRCDDSLPSHSPVSSAIVQPRVASRLDGLHGPADVGDL